MHSITGQALIDRYAALLLDAFGVLVHSGGAMPGAAEFLAELQRAHTPYWVVTNDASKLPATAAARYQSYGLPIAAEQIITSGSLLPAYFRNHGLQGARCLVLGPEDSVRYVAQAEGEVVPPDENARYDAIVVCDDAGYPFLRTLDVALTIAYRHFDRGDDLALILPNPDLVYPRGPSQYGFTSGAAAMILEAALARRYPDRKPEFARLGKPFTPLFDEARRRAGTSSLVMIGDQIETDIAGAHRAGIDSALLCTGISQRAAGHELHPTYVLDRLMP
jgi:HAD superfamily hydrolase (TIGR01450 family)